MIASNHRQPTRRQTLKRLTAAGAAIAAPIVIPVTALGGGGRPAPSERIVMGGIGMGGRGCGDLAWLLQAPEVQFVAVCDINRSARGRAAAMVNQAYGGTDCAVYRDMRDLLAQRADIDAVLIATGDRWHALASIWAMRAGKDVYCEKPGTMTIAEGKAVVDTAQRYARVFQTGTQRLSEANFIVATEMARRGMLGELRTLRAHQWPTVQDVTRNDHLPRQPLPPVVELDWETWLGPAPWRPYNRGYLGGCGAWGVYWDFGAGIAGWGSHTIVQCQAAADALHTSPVAYHYPGNKSGDGMVCRFESGVEIVLQFEGWRGSCGVRFEGSQGWVSVADGYTRPDASSSSLLSEYSIILNRYVSETGRSPNHLRDFLDCVRLRRQPIADAHVMHRSMTSNHAINLCLMLERDLMWDPQAERFIDDDEANRMRSRGQRGPWFA